MLRERNFNFNFQCLYSSQINLSPIMSILAMFEMPIDISLLPFFANGVLTTQSFHYNLPGPLR